MSGMLRDSEEVEIRSRGQRWIMSWHLADAVPAGRKHGAAGICVNDAGEVVVISTDESSWGFPAGRPKDDEDWEQTLRREMLEEACAVVTNARLLGFSRGYCVEGTEAGLVLVRSIWLARVDLLDWNPQFETRFRRLVPAAQAIKLVLPEYEPLWKRAFFEAGIG